MPEPLRVVIAEDNYLVREGTRRLLEDSGGVVVVAAVGVPDELLEAVDRLRPDAVLTDIRMPPGHDVECIHAAHRIRARHPQVGVVSRSKESAVEKYGNAIFSKLGLSEEPQVHRRVAAVLAFLREAH